MGQIQTSMGLITGIPILDTVDKLMAISARPRDLITARNDDLQAPEFARMVDIHRKPGYDPVELHLDPETKTIPLDASLVRGSHGAPATSAEQQGVLLASRGSAIEARQVVDTQVADVILRQFGVTSSAEN